MQSAAVKHLIQSAADELHEKSQPKQSKHDGRHAGQIIDRAANDARYWRKRPGIFRQVDRRNHPDRHHAERHQHHQRQRPKNHREHPGSGRIEHPILRPAGNKTPRNLSGTVPDDIAKNGHDSQHDQRRCRQRHRVKRH